MPFGFDDAAAVASLVGFSAALFHACIQGLIILSKARSFGRDISGIRLMIELEQHKLYTWAEEVGLLQESPALLVSAQRAHLVPKILEHLRELFSDLERLKSDYGLHLQETAEEIFELDESESAFERLGIAESDHSRPIQMKVFKERKKPWKMLKWVAFDEQKVRKLMDQVKMFISELQQILSLERQAKMDKTIDAILRTAVQNTANEQDLDMLGQDYGRATSHEAIAAAARFKKQGLLLGVLDAGKMQHELKLRRRNSPPMSNARRSSHQSLIPRYSNSDLTAMRLSAKRLNISTSTIQDARAIAYYENEPVLLEFRKQNGLDRDAMKDKMCKVSEFLKDLDPSFHGLSCRGYVKIFDRYAFVFHLPAHLRFSKIESSKIANPNKVQQAPAFRALRDLFGEATQPSLNVRVSFAITILETLVQLHTSGWLHKELRSDNVLFILNPRISNSSTDDFLCSPLYLTGYVCARADDPHEATEPRESELEADLYRYPASIGQFRDPYRKAFDIFSVGCILLELGLWCSLSGIVQKAPSRLQSNGSHYQDLMRLRHEVLLSPIEILNANRKRDGADVRERAGIFRMLEAATGNTYSQTVEDLLSAPESVKKTDAAAQGGTDKDNDLLKLEFDCLEKLHAISRAL